MNSEFSDLHQDLAQQLHDDAERLAQLYPPPSVNDLAQRIRERVSAEYSAPQLSVVAKDAIDSNGAFAPSSKLGWSYAAAAAVLFFAVSALLLWRQPNKSQLPNAIDPPAVVTARVTKERAQGELVEPQQFQTLSAPQQEAFLDLLEAHDMPIVSLSI